EVITGLNALTVFMTNDIEVVKTPFGPGCAGIATWPFRYLKEGRLKAVLGGFDPSCRKFFKTDEVTFAVSLELFNRMLERWEETFLNEREWTTVKKKINKSRNTWNDG
ncbi:MAG: DUF169 domain-containing protein, partial [Deltaproteobacteria bacterium]|nr:DUF169 domain-containing protein [Deltaproteobacteria bacterium]